MSTNETIEAKESEEELFSDIGIRSLEAKTTAQLAKWITIGFAFFIITGLVLKIIEPIFFTDFKFNSFFEFFDKLLPLLSTIMGSAVTYYFMRPS